MALLSRKAQAAIVAGLVFFVISSPVTYDLVDSLVGGVVTAIVPAFADVFRVAQAGCPTTYGRLVHAAVFSVITYLMMRAG